MLFHDAREHEVPVLLTWTEALNEADTKSSAGISQCHLVGPKY